MPGKYPGGQKIEYDKYIDRMEKLVRLIVKRLNAKIILFSTEPSEDQETVNRLANRVKDLENVQSIEIDSLPYAFEITRSFDIHIGSRLHTLIFSLAQGVPSVALTSHTRITALFTDLDAKDLIYDIKSFNPDSVVYSIYKLMNERGQKLLDNVDKLRKRSQIGISDMVSEINTYS
jgi:polysaccharide pyruvyl transferase WcaK-like protein